MSGEVRGAVVDLVGWYDRLVGGGEASVGELVRIVDRLERSRPWPGGQVGLDLGHVVAPAPGTGRVEHVEAIERLRFLTRAGLVPVPPPPAGPAGLDDGGQGELPFRS